MKRFLRRDVIGSMLALALAVVPISLSALAHSRSKFEVDLHEPYNHHIACMMMGAGNYAYFPVGVASRRYLLQLIQGEPHLLFQNQVGRRARTVWSVALEDKKGAAPHTGTLRRMLWNRGYVVASGRLNPSMRQALGANKAFAYYGAYGPYSWVEAGFLCPNGTAGAWDAYFTYPGDMPEGRPLFRPIVAEEAAALGLPAKPWHGPGPLSFAHVSQGGDVTKAPVQEVP